MLVWFGEPNSETSQEGLAQTNSIPVAEMINPATDTGSQFVQRKLTGFDRRPNLLQLALEMQAFPALEATPMRIDGESEKRDSFRHRPRMRAGMNREPQTGQPFYQGFLP